MSTSLSYWKWFAKGHGAKPGYKRLLSNWLVLHVIVGILVSILVKVDLHVAANSVLLPLAGIFVGLCFAWAGNAQALLQSPEIQELSDYHEGGFVEYVFAYQTAILVLLSTMVLWGLAGLQVFTIVSSTLAASGFTFTVKTILFTFSSLALRECWHVVLGAQWMLMAQRKIRKNRVQSHPDDDKQSE